MSADWTTSTQRGLPPRLDPQDAPPLGASSSRPLGNPPRPAPPVLFTAAEQPPRQGSASPSRRAWLVGLGVTALAATTVTAVCMMAFRPAQVPAAAATQVAIPGQSGTAAVSGPSATQPDFTTIPDPCALPVPATLQRLSPGATWWPTRSVPEWECTWMSTVDHQGSRMHRTVRLRITIAAEGASDDARAVARAAFEDQRRRDRATWGTRYRTVPQLGERAYTGYTARAAKGKAKTAVHLRNLVFDVTYGGDTWNPPGPDAPPQEPLAEPAARAGAMQLAREITHALARCAACSSGAAAP